MSRKFITDREIAFINSINKELIQSVVGQEISYYSISLEKSRANRLYDEAIEKVWDPPVLINARIMWDNTQSASTSFGVDSKYSLEVYFHNKELEERNILPKEGDFIEFGEVFFEITSVTQPQIVFGQINNKIMTKCVCVPSREGQFQAGARDSEGIQHTHPVEQVIDPDLVDVPPQITSLRFTGNYPGSQTELKAGDTFQVTGTTNKAAVGVRVLDFGAATLSEISFSSTTTFTVTVTIADRGTTTQSLTAKLQARNNRGSYGNPVATSNTVVLNNTIPSLQLLSISYPINQMALKNSESALVDILISDADTMLFESPNNELSVLDPTVIETPKTVTRIAGTYNISATNFRATANRAANNSQAVLNTNVAIVNVAPSVSAILPAARLRSGGNDGTVVQDHVIALSSDQPLYVVPVMDEAIGGGTFLADWSGFDATWTRTLQVHDNQTKGIYSWRNMSFVGLSGLTTTTLNSGTTYELGGFVARTITFAPFSHTATINVAVSQYSLLQAGVFTATNQQSFLNVTQGNHSNIADTFTVNSVGSNPTTVYWNDDAAAGSNSSGLAQLLSLEELITSN